MNEFTTEELELIKKRGISLSGSTNGGFGFWNVNKKNGKIVYYSYAPGSWDMDTGRVDYYSTYSVEYNSIEDYVSHKNGTVLIDKDE